MIMTGNVVGVQLNIDLTAQSGNSYKAYRLMIETNGKIETIQKPMASIKFKPQVQGALKTLKAGDVVTVVMEKNKAGYMEVENITVGGMQADSLSVNDAPAVVSTPPKVFNGGGRDFETKEERAAKQVMIVKQSSLAQAVNLLPKGKKEEVVELAQYFTDWVLGVESQNVVGENYPDIEDDIPF